jgi:diguanylate cyclase (GGDEF)-like protein
MNSFQQNFDIQTACLIASVVMSLLSVTALIQIQQLPRYKIPLTSLACALFFATIAMTYLGIGWVDSDRASWAFAHACGTLAYYFFVISVVQLFRPDMARWIPASMILIATLVTLALPQGLSSAAWATVTRAALTGLIPWVAITTRNRDTPFMRNMAIALSLLSILGMSPQVLSMFEAWRTNQTYSYKSDPSAVYQTISWITSSIMSFVTITAIIQGRVANRLSYAADFDALTQIKNRRALIRDGEAMLNRQHSAALLIDVDHFKKLNDTYGHLVGDAALVHIANIIKNSVNSENSTVGRYGGEEFCVFLADTTSREAALVAERIRAAIETNELSDEGVKIKVEVSIGVAALEPGQSLKDWLRQADIRLYEAKVSGRNRVSANLSLTHSEGPGFIV